MGGRELSSAVSFVRLSHGDCQVLKKLRVAATGVVAVTVIGVNSNVHAQQAAPATAVFPGPAVNEVAPDFSLAGADRYGLLRTPVRLSDYRGRTVVLAFFFQARTKG